MADLITYVIVGLFFVFFIYFLYTVLDVFFLSKRKRKIKSPVEKKGDNESKTGKDDDDKDDEKKEDSNVSEDKKESGSVEKSDDARYKEDNSKEDDSISEKEKREYSDNLDFKKSDMVSVENKDKKVVTKKKIDFSFFTIFKKKKKAIFEPQKIDEKYNNLVVDFVVEKDGSWNQTEFQEFVLLLIKKGYDKKPSEISEDLEIVKKEISEEKRIKAESNLVHDNSENSHTNEDSEKSTIVSSDSESRVNKLFAQLKKKDSEENRENDSGDERKDNSSESSSHDKDENKDDDKPNEKDDDSEKELKELAEKNKESIDTRSELDKTLEEIRAIRKRLSER